MKKGPCPINSNYGIDAITETGGTGGFTADYGLDAIGNVTSVTERDTLARDFAYDGQDRLRAMTNGGSNVESFEYDATGNRKSKTLAAATSTYTIATPSHRLTNVSNQGTRLYDPAGNTTLVNTGAPAIYGYDERGRLRTVTLNATLQRTYKYNGKGERVLRIAEAGTAQSLQFVYDEAGHLLGEYTTAGARVAEYVWLGDVLVGVLRSHDGSTYQFVETDHPGTPRAVINPINNAVIWRWDLTTTTFGDHRPANNPDGNAIAYGFNLRYPGQYYDGLEYVYYNYFRDYDSRTGRYLQSDPIGLAGGMSTYTYVGGAPMANADPLGLACVNKNGWLTCVYPGKGGPSFRLPIAKNNDFPSFSSKDPNYHRTSVARAVRCMSDKEAFALLAANPTTLEGGPKAATTGGTKNNASVFGATNFVRSYLTTDLRTGEPLVVNLTDGGSLFRPGYISRRVRNGQAETLGEGTSPFQSENLLGLGGAAGPISPLDITKQVNELFWGDDFERLMGNRCACSE